jgi:hypothetical protein
MVYRNQYQNHLKTCGYCRNQKENNHKAKLVELGHMIKGIRPVPDATKGASSDSHSNPRPTLRRYKVLSDKQRKLKKLARLIRGV